MDSLASALERWRAADCNQRTPVPVIGAVWRGVTAGLTTREIGDALGVSAKRVENVIYRWGMTSRVRRGRPSNSRIRPCVNLLEEIDFRMEDIHTA